ncbi:unnamed protein product, partial [Timema podura]|nr:unnamed protein product [Timema podura]
TCYIQEQQKSLSCYIQKQQKSLSCYIQEQQKSLSCYIQEQQKSLSCYIQEQQKSLSCYIQEQQKSLSCYIQEQQKSLSCYIQEQQKSLSCYIQEQQKSLSCYIQEQQKSLSCYIQEQQKSLSCYIQEQQKSLSCYIQEQQKSLSFATYITAACGLVSGWYTDGQSHYRTDARCCSSAAYIPHTDASYLCIWLKGGVHTPSLEERVGCMHTHSPCVDSGQCWSVRGGVCKSASEVCAETNSTSVMLGHIIILRLSKSFIQVENWILIELSNTLSKDILSTEWMNVWYAVYKMQGSHQLNDIMNWDVVNPRHGSVHGWLTTALQLDMTKLLTLKTTPMIGDIQPDPEHKEPCSTSFGGGDPRWCYRGHVNSPDGEPHTMLDIMYGASSEDKCNEVMLTSEPTGSEAILRININSLSLQTTASSRDLNCHTQLTG